jgi:exopolysaccharide production protein ExoZ
MNFFQFGHAGVDLFFVISGFIILFVHYDDIGCPKCLGRYLGRRFTRIMPTYWIALALTIILRLSGGHALPSSFDMAWSAALLPSHNEPLLGVAWTLQFEIVFYAVFCFLILNRIMGITVLSLWLAWIILARFSSSIGNEIPNSLYGFYNLEFFFGMAVAYWLRTHTVPVPRLILVAGTALFAAAAVAENTQLMDGYTDFSRLVYGSAAALIVLGAAEAGRRRLIAIPMGLRTLGTASYSIYLFQFVFIGALWKLWLATGLAENLPHAASFPVLAIAGVLGGIAMSRLVEYPLMGLVRRSHRTAPGVVVT